VGGDERSSRRRALLEEVEGLDLPLVVLSRFVDAWDFPRPTSPTRGINAVTLERERDEDSSARRKRSHFEV